ncbi:MAG: hypothetical protein J7M05_01140, partial [Anaerolineae bacterium]|nr:hypothetical protein [Anaerolineae bacterium]
WPRMELWLRVWESFLGLAPEEGLLFFYILLRVYLWLVALAGGLYRPLRRVEVGLPDAVG